MDSKVHYHICDGCKCAPIFGIMYKCKVCSDFDFCENCHKTRKHQHEFTAIESNETHDESEFKLYTLDKSES